MKGWKVESAGDSLSQGSKSARPLLQKHRLALHCYKATAFGHGKDCAHAYKTGMEAWRKGWSPSKARNTDYRTWEERDSTE